MLAPSTGAENATLIATPPVGIAISFASGPISRVAGPFFNQHSGQGVRDGEGSVWRGAIAKPTGDLCLKPPLEQHPSVVSPLLSSSPSLASSQSLVSSSRGLPLFERLVPVTSPPFARRKTPNSSTSRFDPRDLKGTLACPSAARPATDMRAPLDQVDPTPHSLLPTTNTLAHHQLPLNTHSTWFTFTTLPSLLPLSLLSFSRALRLVRKLLPPCHLSR